MSSAVGGVVAFVASVATAKIDAWLRVALAG